MDQAMGSFHHRGVQQITWRKPMSQEEGGWEYSMLATAMGEAGFEEIRVCIKRSQNTVAQYIVTQPILDPCERYIRSTGAWVSWRWWDQEGIDLVGERQRAAAESGGEEEKYGEGEA